MKNEIVKYENDLNGYDLAISAPLIWICSC